MASNVFEVGSLIFVKNSMRARVYTLMKELSGGRTKWYFDATPTHLPFRHPVVFLDETKDGFGRNFLRVIGPDGICCVKKEAFL